MIPRWCGIGSIGLGLLVGAIFHVQVASAQGPPVPPPVVAQPDSAVQDSVRARILADSIAAADTLRAPVFSYPVPGDAEEVFRWTGDEILASGATTLVELISRVPGATSFRGGYVVAPSSIAYMGCFTCVRIFSDGIELAALNPRTNGVMDHSELPLRHLSEVVVIRGASELRVYTTSWGVDRTIPFTRVDILTGSDETSLFSAFFGRRYKRGEILQITGQQFGTSARVFSGAGNRNSITARVGKIRENWGIDAFVVRTSVLRDEQQRGDGFASAAAFEGTRTDAYLRGTLGRPSEGAWLQVLAASLNVKERTPGSGPPPAQEGEPEPPPADTSRTESQYFVTGGRKFGEIETSGSLRLRSLAGERTTEFTLGASGNLGPARVSLFGRRDSRDSVQSGEVAVRLAPFGALTLSGVLGTVMGTGDNAGAARLFGNAEVGISAGEMRFSGGVLLRDSLSLRAPSGFDEGFVQRDESAATGIYGRMNGRFWRAMHADFTALQWQTEGLYRPRMDLRGSVYVETSWLNRFPNNTFHVHAGVTYESRSDASFPLADQGSVVAAGHSIISTLLEIRILSAVISWQNRNIRGLEMSAVPGYQLPRRLNVYGIRWVLWN